MLVRKSVPMLAAAATLLASTTPAYAFDSQAPSSGGQPTPAVVQQHPAGSTDWLLIGVTAGGAITLAGAGVGATRHRRATATTRTKRLRPAGGS